MESLILQSFRFEFSFVGIFVSCLKYTVEEHFEKNRCIVTLAVVTPVVSKLSIKQTKARSSEVGNLLGVLLRPR